MYLNLNVYAHNPFKKILEKEKYKLHTIARLTVLTRALCHKPIENLLK